MRRAILGLVLIAGCGNDVAAPVASTAASPPTVAPSTTVAPATTVAEPFAPTDRIIPLDGDIAEIVFALGMGGRVVATDLSATYPPEADMLPQIGYQRALSAEPILAFEPTLLIGTDVAGPPEALDELERVGVPVAIVDAPATPAGPADKIRAVARVLGIPDVGDRLAAGVQAAIDAATPTDPTAEPAAALRVAMLYIRGESTQLIFGEGSGIDWIIEATGASDVADELGIVDNAEITAEALLTAAPDVLLVTEDGLASVGGIDGLVALPTVAGTPAAQRRAVLAYDAQLMLGNGPRTGDFLAQLGADLNDLAAQLASEPEDG